MNRRQRRAQWQARQRPLSVAAKAPAAVRAPGAPTAGPSAVKLEIGELVLRGFEKRHSSRIAAAFERSLAERLGSGEFPALLRQAKRGASLRLAPLTLRRASDPVAIGEQLAAAVLSFQNGERRRGGPR